MEGLYLTKDRAIHPEGACHKLHKSFWTLDDLETHILDLLLSPAPLWIEVRVRVTLL